MRANIFHVGEADGGESVSPAVPGERGEEEFKACLSTLEDAGEGEGFPPRTGFLQGCWPLALTLLYQVLSTLAA